MIIIQLIGGLGNQMFQYALGRAISIKINTPFALDISKYYDYPLRTYKLSSFNIVENIVNKDQVNTIKSGLMSYTKRKLKSLHIIPYYKLNYIIEEFNKYYTYDPNMFKIGKNVYIEGYWQSEKYFKEIKSIIQNDFKLKTNLSYIDRNTLKLINNSDSISIHIRRGDYVSNPIVNQVHGTCSLDYYYDAIDHITRKIDNPHFFIFSDDIEWVKNNFSINFPNCFVSGKGNEDYIDLTIMKNCKHHIIANSSFSWWGAWLSENPEKIVCAPKRWVNNRKIILNDLLPNEWIRV